MTLPIHHCFNIPYLFFILLAALILYSFSSTRSGFHSAKHSQKEQRSQHQTVNKNNSPYLPSKSIEVVEQKESLFSKPAASLLRNETSHDTNTPALITGKDYTPDDYEEIIRNLKRLNAKQASEVNYIL